MPEPGDPMQQAAMKRQQERMMKNRIEKQQQLKAQGAEQGKDNKPGGDFNLLDSLVGSENPEVWSHKHAKEIMEIGYDPANAKSFWEESNWDKANEREEGVLKSLIRGFKEQVRGPGVEAKNRENAEFAAKRAQEGFSLMSNALFGEPAKKEAA